MDKGKQVMLDNNRSRKRKARKEDDEYVEVLKIHHEHEIKKLRKHYMGMIDRMERHMKAKDDAFGARVKYERKNAKVTILLKQISCPDFDMQSELDRLEAREDKMYEEWVRIEIPYVGFERDGSGGPSSPEDNPEA